MASRLAPKARASFDAAIAQARRPRAGSRKGRKDRPRGPETGLASSVRRSPRPAIGKRRRRSPGSWPPVHSRATPPQPCRARTAAGPTRASTRRSADKDPHPAMREGGRLRRIARRSSRPISLTDRAAGSAILRTCFPGKLAASRARTAMLEAEAVWKRLRPP